MDYLQFQELYHHGIKGMKWGVRRYENEDGSLTEEGKARYGYSDEYGSMSKAGKKLYKSDVKEYKDKEKAFNSTVKVLSKMNKEAREEWLSKNKDTKEVKEALKEAAEAKARTRKIVKISAGVTAAAAGVAAVAGIKIADEALKENNGPGLSGFLAVMNLAVIFGAIK